MMRRVVLLSASLAVVASAFVAARQQTPLSATLTDATVRLLPSGATFRIPDAVRSGTATRQLSVYLSAADRERIRQPSRSGGGDGHYSSIVNAVLPFEACAVHIGTEPFGPAGVVFSDLQFRAYVIDDAAQPVLGRILGDGLRQAQGLEGVRDATITRPESSTPWALVRIAYTLFPADYEVSARLDSYVREFGKSTVVLVFMYSPSPRWPWEPSIAQIVASFWWPAT